MRQMASSSSSTVGHCAWLRHQGCASGGTSSRRSRRTTTGPLMTRSQQTPHARAGKCRDRIGEPANNDGAGCQILRDDHPEGQETVLADRHTLSDAGLAAEEAACADPRRPGNPDLARQKAVVPDDAVMAYVI